MSTPGNTTRGRNPIRPKTIAKTDLGWGEFEVRNATAGDFEASYARHTIVVSQSHPSGPIELNGNHIEPPALHSYCYSVFRPDDHVSGTFVSDVHYDMLTIDDAFLRNVLLRETGLEIERLPPAIRLSPRPLFINLWQRLKREIEAKQFHVGFNAETLTALLLVLLAEPLLVAVPAKTNNRSSQAITRAMVFIQNNLDARLDLDTVAGKAGLSTFHFARLFKANTGLSIHRHIMERRLEAARELLARTMQPISTIALETGFSSQSHLTTAFRKRYAMTPRAFRVSLNTVNRLRPNSAILKEGTDAASASRIIPIGVET